jgi:hypothetical protein
MAAAAAKCKRPGIGGKSDDNAPGRFRRPMTVPEVEGVSELVE